MLCQQRALMSVEEYNMTGPSTEPCATPSRKLPVTHIQPSVSRQHLSCWTKTRVTPEFGSGSTVVLDRVTTFMERRCTCCFSYSTNIHRHEAQPGHRVKVSYEQKI